MSLLLTKSCWGRLSELGGLLYACTRRPSWMWLLQSVNQLSLGGVSKQKWLHMCERCISRASHKLQVWLGLVSCSVRCIPVSFGYCLALR